MEINDESRRPQREEVLLRLRHTLPGTNLWQAAQQLEVPIQWGPKKNKGWVGQTIERLAGLPISSEAQSDGQDFELKTTTLKWSKEGWTPKETLKITQLNPQAILEEEFFSSLFWEKMGRMILVGCVVIQPDRVEAKKLLSITISNSEVVSELKSFWEDVRHLVCSGELKNCINLGSSDSLVQLRPVGDGKQMSQCPISGEYFPARAFYATKKLLNLLMRLEGCELLPG